MLRLFVPGKSTTTTTTKTMLSRSRVTSIRLPLFRRMMTTPTTISPITTPTPPTRNGNIAFMSTMVSTTTINPTTIVIDDRQEETQKKNKSTSLKLHPLYPKLFTPYELGNDLGVLPNRILMGSMHTGLEGHSMPSYMESFLHFIDKEDNDRPHSHSLDRMAMYFRRRAMGGVGLMVTGGIAPNYEGWVGPFAAQLTTEQEMEKHKVVTNAVHEISIPIYGSSSSSPIINNNNNNNEGVVSVPAKIILQILHTGRYAYHPFAVSAEHGSKSPISPFKAKGLSTQGVHRTISDFVTTASLALQAGYDGIEIMGSEGYLLSQFLSPSTNSSPSTTKKNGGGSSGRLDNYGGQSFENRSRFPIEVVTEIRKQLGNDFIIIFRISLLELIDNGMSWTETTQLATELTKAGVTILNTGIGWHESRIPTISSNVPRGAFVSPTKQLKYELEQQQQQQQFEQGFTTDTDTCIPAIVSTNRINAPDTAEQILQDDTSDLVSMARPLLADPDFIQKAYQQKSNSINTCIACNQACLDHAFVGKTASCLVNPAACHESELDLQSMEGMNNSMNTTTTTTANTNTPQNFTLPVKDRLNIGVIGAGPAGIAFACTAAEIGHNVTLFERTSNIGGQFHMAKRVPGKEEFYEAIRYWENRCNISLSPPHPHQEEKNENITVGSITVELNTEMTVDDMSTLTRTTTEATSNGSIDKWIVSTGVVPRDLILPGSEHFPDRVLSYVDVLRHNKPVGKRVAVIGAGGIGFDVAEFLLYANTTASNDDDDDDDTTTTTTTTATTSASCPAATVSKEEFWKEWGVDPTQEYRGGLVKDKKPSSSSVSSNYHYNDGNGRQAQAQTQPEDRSIYLMQRKKGKVGKGLGRTTGWIHRASLKNSNRVTNIAGVQSYDYINENGHLVYTDSNDGKQHVLEVDTIVSCAGQIEERTLEKGSKYISTLQDIVYPIGGAYKAGELDAKRAIDMGTRLAHNIHLKDVTPGNHVFHSSVGTEEKLFRFLKKWM